VMTKKFTPKFLGPYKVKRIINPVTYELKLPPTLKIHPVFHVSLLQPWKQDVEFHHPDPNNRPPPIVPEDNQYIVEALTDKRRLRVGRNQYVTQYYCKWKGYPIEEMSWENAEDIEDSLIAEYESTHHAKIPVTTRSTRKSVRRRARS
jgi:Chromo (CHRromatin Organisation MOdifier) domain